MSENGYVFCGVCGYRCSVDEALEHDWEYYGLVEE